MIMMTVLVSALSIYEMGNMWKKRLFKEIVVFGCIAVLALFLGGLTILGPYKTSLVKLLGLKF